ncbi:DUF2971 domain-containing protein [Pseudomonas sp. S32]|uniref:DUF2971 domain-containing protein n=1 Tax=Pseudomonas sp. S32 TaxID=2767448 RepID=UPI001912A3EB|nr:DUF2971 domain-containing protein [Pseudomonas sp. S32]MBK5007323.1 hypothetical protein [Pseudomonas sp. S32]
MPAVLVGDLKGEDVIWRYMALDKFVNILDDKALFMPALGMFSESDPYEGYPPPAVLKCVKNVCPPSMYFSHDADKLQDLSNFKVFAQRLFKSRVVSCWYQSQDESEAMWKLYGDAGKAIAIRTTVERLAGALGEDFQGKIARVHYVDYVRTTQLEYDVVMGSHVQNTLLDPVYKRSSYAHEREVRVYKGIDGARLDEPETFVSHMAPIDCRLLIDEVVVSPLCSPSYVKAVKAVARQFGLGDAVRQSTLLSDLGPIYRSIENP